MKFLLGTKVNMTEIFDEAGIMHPVTILKAGPVTVTQIKTSEKDGYSSVQVGYGAKTAKNVNKAVIGHLKGKGPFAHIKEFRIGKADTAPALGDAIDASIFKVGDAVVVAAISKGKGFQGVVKRHHFKGGSRTHGQKHSENEPGAIGGGGGRAGGRVAKGIRMAGRMGGTRITVKNLKVMGVDPVRGEIFIRGAIPGKRGTLVEIMEMEK